MVKTKFPDYFQAVVWSRYINNLDLSKDKEYIINQVLAYGLFDHLKWLFKNYSKKVILSTFLKNPIKIYSYRSLNFVKVLLFGNKKFTLDESSYVKSISRNI
ncbi:MAG: hypothetical protein AAB656_03440 [Patescibacteria group bacterium]